MIIPGLILTVLAVLVSLIAFLIGLIGWIILKLMKDELHLDITIDSNKKTK
jgi:hypothetical protein